MAHRKPEIEKICPYCDKPFIREHVNRKYCRGCSEDAFRANRQVNYYKDRKLSPISKRVCPYCKIGFETRWKHKKYCTPKHKTLAERARHKTLEGREKRKAEHTKYREKAARKKKHNEYMRKYYQEVIKPRKLAAAKLPPQKSKLQPIEIISKSPEWILRNWDRIA